MTLGLICIAGLLLMLYGLGMPWWMVLVILLAAGAGYTYGGGTWQM